MIGLKDEPDLAAAQQRHLVFSERGDLLAIQHNLAAGGRIQPGQQAQQRALTAARRAHDGGELSARDLQVDSFENIYTVRTGVNGLREAADLDQILL